jgi:hypothetical protein
LRALQPVGDSECLGDISSAILALPEEAASFGWVTTRQFRPESIAWNNRQAILNNRQTIFPNGKGHEKELGKAI